jgi:iron complex transport system ATP-binding protein
MVMGILSVKDLCFKYDKELILEGLELEMEEDGIVMLLGPNGCGKTTLLDCITGYRRYERGSIKLDGVDDKDYAVKEKARKIAYVPQSASNVFPYSVFQMVLMGRTPYLDGASSPRREDEEIALGALESLGLMKFKDRNYSNLSGGERQLVLIARALAQDTQIILFDEPTSSLDLKNESIVLDKIKSLAGKTNKSAIIATHQPNHAFYFENEGIRIKVALFAQRKIKYFGSPSGVLTGGVLSEVYGVGCDIYEYAENRKIIVVN